jgi:hypothetical protein
MNKLDTLNKLNKIASVLENNGNVKEAEILTDVMIKLSQTSGVNPFRGGVDLDSNAAVLMNQALDTAYLKHQQDNAQYAKLPAGQKPTTSAAWDHIRAQKTKLDSIDRTAYPKLEKYFAQWAQNASKDKLLMQNRNLTAPGITNTTNQTQNAEIANLVRKAVEVHNQTNNGWAYLKDQLHKHPTLSLNNQAMIEAKNQFYYATQPGTPNPTPGKPVGS